MLRILIADDEIINLTLLKKILDFAGTCDLVNNGKEAVEFFQMAIENQEPYDLVLMDIMMPIMDGQEALQAIRAFEQEQGHTGLKETIIIMVSALDTENQVVNAFFKGGCTDYLTKPVIRKNLITKLMEYKLLPEDSLD